MKKKNVKELATKERVYQFIRQFIREHQFSPTMREISEGVGVSISVVYHYITDLVYEKRITKKEKCSRSICLVETDVEDPLSEHENLRVRTITMDTHSYSIVLSEQFSDVCTNFYQYLKSMRMGIKVWRNPRGKYLLVIDRRAIYCDIDLYQQSSEITVMQKYYLSLLEFYKHFFERYNVEFVPPIHTEGFKHEGGGNNQLIIDIY